MQILASYDDSVSSAPAGYLTAVAAAIDYLDSIIVNTLTVTINFGWGEVDGNAIPSDAVASSNFLGRFYSYNQIAAALARHATSATDVSSVNTLPATDPAGSGRYFVTTAEAVALGLSTASSIVGYVGLNSSLRYAFDPNNRAVAGAHDAIGAIEHEITEVLGRVGFLGSHFDTTSNNIFAPLDLFRYSPTGVIDTAANAFFSIDGGKTLLTKFNDPTNGGDVGDWDSSVRRDSFGDNGTGVASVMTATDLQVMDVLGYSLSGSTGVSQTAIVGNTTFVSTPGNDFYAGLSGINTVTYVGHASGYAIGSSGAFITVTDSTVGRDGTDTLSHIQQARFVDYTVDFDLTSAQDLKVYELYQAAYGRTPDNAGFRYWAGVADTTQASAVALADQFLAAPEFTQVYGAKPTNTDYVTGLYSHVLGRAPDASGLAFWVGQADSGVARDLLLVAFATSNENVQLIGAHTANGFWTT